MIRRSVWTPTMLPAYGNRAILHYQMNNMKDALADLNEAISSEYPVRAVITSIEVWSGIS